MDKYIINWTKETLKKLDDIIQNRVNVRQFKWAKWNGMLIYLFDFKKKNFSFPIFRQKFFFAFFISSFLLKLMKNVLFVRSSTLFHSGNEAKRHSYCHIVMFAVHVTANCVPQFKIRAIAIFFFFFHFYFYSFSFSIFRRFSR